MVQKSDQNWLNNTEQANFTDRMSLLASNCMEKISFTTKALETNT